MKPIDEKTGRPQNEARSEAQIRELYLAAVKESMPKSVLTKEGSPHVAAMTDALEELNFRLAAFARAYLGNQHDVASCVSRAEVLEKHMGDFGVMLMIYVDHHKSLLKPKV